MNYQFDLLSWSLFISFLISISVAVFSFTHRKSKSTIYLILLTLAISEWAFAGIFETAALSIDLKILWTRISYLGIVLTPLFYLLLALSHGQHENFLKKRLIALLALVPALTFIIAITPKFQQWLWLSISISENGNIGLYEHGFWFYVNAFYSYLLILVGLALIFNNVRRISAPLRGQNFTLLLGASLPLVANVIYVFNINPIPGLDWTPVAFSISSLLLALGILRFDLLKIVPVARDLMVDTIVEGVMVLDMDNRIVDLNPAMSQIIDQDIENALGSSASVVFENWPELLSSLNEYFEFQNRFVTKIGGQESFFEVRVSTIEKTVGNPIGRLMVCHNVTKSETSHRKLIEAQKLAKIGDFTWNVITDEVTWSEGMFNLLNYDKDEAIDYAKVNQEIHHPDDLERVTAWLQENLASGNKKLTPNEYRLIRKDGEIIHVHTEGNIEYKDGKAVSVFGTSQDISKRLQAERQIKDNLLFVNSIIDESPFAMWISDTSGTVQRTNKTLQNLLGLSNEQIVGKYNVFNDKNIEVQGVVHLVKAVYGDLQTARFSIWWDAEQSGDLQYKGARSQWIDVVMFPILDGDQNLSSVVCQWIDITDRKKAEESVRENEAKLRNLLNNLDAGVVVHAPDTSITLNNPKAAELLGLDDDQLRGRKAFDPEWKFVNEYQSILPLEEYPVNQIVSRRQILKNMVVGVPRPNTGDLVWLLVNGFPVIDPQNVLIEIIITFIDITEIKEAEEERLKLETQLRQSQKLEAVGTMAGGIAHDFNNLLQGIFLYSDIVKNQLPDDEQLRSNFQQIINASERARDLVKHILTFSRIEDAELKPTRIQHLLKNALKLIRASIPSSIDIVEKIDNHCGSVLCDASQLHQVVVNLCNNASFAMRDRGGTLSVSLHQAETPIEQVPGKSVLSRLGTLELSVSDTGEGMDAETLERIFDPFFSTKKVNEGTGLGLSIVYGIVRDMQGQIKVESEPGKGSTFRILLPLSEDQEAVEDEKASDGIPVRRLRILMVDDDKMITEAGKYILEAKGHSVEIADDGLAALERFTKDEQRYDLIITDLTMPRMSGLELGREIRKHSMDINMILTSGNLNPELQEEYQSLGFNNFVRKPWSASDMLEAVASLDFD
ncbi:MAG: PAS domain S-box protein [Candidatus Marinimicrobia bacterium]|nr:PAS domain S-box protein [Candidatus Neomarinimicrobiota bacterium]